MTLINMPTPDPLQHNMPGVVSFQFVPLPWVESVPAPMGAHTLASAVVLKAGKSWLDGYSTLGALEYEEQLVQAGGIEQYLQRLKGKVPGHSAALQQQLDGMAKQQHLVLLKDTTGLQWLLGNLTRGCRLTWSYNSGSTNGGWRGYSYTFSLECKHPALVYAP